MQAIWNVEKKSYDLTLSPEEMGIVQAALVIARNRAPEDTDFRSLDDQFHQIWQTASVS